METVGHVRLGNINYPLMRYVENEHVLTGCPCCGEHVIMEKDYDNNNNLLIRHWCEYCGEFYTKP